MSITVTPTTPPTPLPPPVSGTFELRLARDLVTVQEYNNFSAATGRSPNDGNPDDPVVNTTWYEAKAYATWYSEQHDVKARLPYEWELVLAEQIEGIAGYDFSAWPQDSITTARVPGRHYNDVSGRVVQWCEDGDDSGRVCRGGSWADFARFCRAASRSRYSPYSRWLRLGFRLAFDA